MKRTLFHHLPDGTFRNPEGSPKRNINFRWSFKVFNKEKKKLDMSIPKEHVVKKEKILSDLSNLKNRNPFQESWHFKTKNNKAVPKNS